MLQATVRHLSLTLSDKFWYRLQQNVISVDVAFDRARSLHVAKDSPMGNWPCLE